MHTHMYLLGMHRIPYFRIRPDPDPSGSITVRSGRIRILTGSRDFGSGRIQIFTGSGCNLIRIKAELQPIVCCHCLSKHRIIKHRIIKDNRQDKFLICCDAAPFLTYNLSLVCCLALGDWYYMVMNPVDRIQTVWIRPDPDFAGS